MIGIQVDLRREDRRKLEGLRRISCQTKRVATVRKSLEQEEAVEIASGRRNHLAAFIDRFDVNPLEPGAVVLDQHGFHRTRADQRNVERGGNSGARDDGLHRLARRQRRIGQG